MRTQHQIASELHALVCPEDYIHDAEGCPTLEDILAALREQSLVTRAAIVTDLENFARRWWMEKRMILACAEMIRSEINPRGAE